MSACCATISAFMASLSGPIDQPSPITSSVTPWRMSLCERPSSIRDSLAQDIMLMKPGATARPVTSISRSAVAPPMSPSAVILSSSMATSPW